MTTHTRTIIMLSERTSERTQVEHGPIRTKKIAEHRLQVTRTWFVFVVERTPLRGLAHPRMDRLRAFKGHQVDMQGLSALSLGEFGDVVSNAAAMHRVQSGGCPIAL